MLMKKLLTMFLACCSVAIAEPQVRVRSYVFEFPSTEVNYLGENAGIHIGQNPVTAGTVGLLGLPGVGLVFMLRRLFIL